MASALKGGDEGRDTPVMIQESDNKKRDGKNENLTASEFIERTKFNGI